MSEVEIIKPSVQKTGADSTRTDEVTAANGKFFSQVRDILKADAKASGDKGAAQGNGKLDTDRFDKVTLDLVTGKLSLSAPADQKIGLSSESGIFSSRNGKFEQSKSKGPEVAAGIEVSQPSNQNLEKSDNPYTDAHSMALQLKQDVKDYEQPGGARAVLQDLDAAKSRGYLNELERTLVEQGIGKIDYDKKSQAQGITFSRPETGKSIHIELKNIE